MNFHMIHYTQIIWEEVAFIWKVTGKAVAIFMTGTVHVHGLGPRLHPTSIPVGLSLRPRLDFIYHTLYTEV